MVTFRRRYPRPPRAVIADRITKGSVIAFVELNLSEFPGETTVISEVFGLDNYHAHAFGWTYQNSLGGFRNAEVFGFHATKVMDTFEGGMIATNDDALANRRRWMRRGYPKRARAGFSQSGLSFCWGAA